jgi:hypothetical protein
MCFLRGTDHVRNTTISNALQTYASEEIIQDYKWKCHNHNLRMDSPPATAKIRNCQPDGQSHVGWPRRRWRVVFETEQDNKSMPSSGMWRRVDLVLTDVSEERITSISRIEKSASEEPAWEGGCRQQDATTCSRWFFIRAFFYPENGGDMFLRNVGSHKI